MQAKGTHSENKTNVMQNTQASPNLPENATGIEDGGEVKTRLSEIVSELPPEQKQTSPAGGGTTHKSHKLTAAQMRAKLLANLPSEKRMKTDISTEIEKEVEELKSKAKSMRYFGPANYYEMNNIIAKIHELNDILSSLVTATFEMLKSLWLRFVHGIAI
ncbi:MAG: hypothetical protein UT33_C0006G0087 [Candidatus Peregrinibacteria bacterium GW2011_GWC2_39_14]|nr:MAG: hypothetical protein UT33_C0006G0087 [Candidatus Peregrinibacteria bacterium GW2011_GWC2_39_14]